MKTAKIAVVLLAVLIFATTFAINASAWDYKVVKGDSFWKISQKYSVNFKELIKANPQFENHDLIYPDDVIHMPDTENGEYADAEVRGLFDSINDFRSKEGLKELSLDKKVSAAAQAKAEDLAAKNYFSHISPTYGTPSQMLNDFGISYRYMGENIAKGASAQKTVNAWMNSKGHRDNILNQNFTKIGVGYCQSEKIWVTIFI